MTIQLIIAKIAPMIISAFALITSLAWNDAIKNELQKYPLLKTYGNWLYAIIITIISSIVVYFLSTFDRKRIPDTFKS